MATRDTRDGGQARGAARPRFCSNCGSEATGLSFCSSCGSPIARDEDTEELRPFEGSRAAARRRAEGLDSDRLRSIEQAASATPAAPPAAEAAAGTYAPAPGRSRRPLLAAIVAAAIVAVAGAAAAVLLLSGGGSAATSYRDKLSAAFAPLIDANRGLSASLAGLHGTDASAAQGATSRAQTASSSARGAINALTVPAASQQLASQASQALDREDSYLSAVSVTLGNPSSPVVSQLQALAGNLTSAFDAVGAPLAGASQSVSGADTLTTWAQHAAHQSQQQTGNTGGSQSSSSGAAHQPSTNPFANGRDCGGGLFAGPSTSCDFAQNVRSAYDAAPGATATVNVYSPVTGQTYAMSCSPAGAGITCSGGNGASVAW